MKPPIFLGPLSTRFGRLIQAASFNVSTVSPTLWTANLAWFHPVVIPFAYPMKRFFFSNGNTIGNVDLGLYSKNGARLISTGSQTRVVSSGHDYFSAPYLIPPGAYYLALAFNNASSTINSPGTIGANTAFQRFMGVLVQTSAFPLPVTMNPTAAGNTFNVYPIYGITLTESGF